MDEIIDAHSHLGDILYHGGGELIGQTGVKMEPIFDPAAISERTLHRDFLGSGRLIYSLLEKWITRAERARNFTATLENFSNSMEETGVTYSICLPVPPHVTFADLQPVADEVPGVIPFTGVDYNRDRKLGIALEADVKAGARGLKLHPIIQNVPLMGERTRAAIDAFSVHCLPVLFHCGVSSYYLGIEKVKENPSYGEIHYGAELVREFPEVSFIAGHSGLFEVRDVIKMMGGRSNVWVDTSFQSVAMVRELIGAFGPERVLFASDWPYGKRAPALAIARAACDGDAGLERRVLFENAAELLGLS